MNNTIALRGIQAIGRHDWRNEGHRVTLADLRRNVEQRPGDVIESLIPQQSVNILVGDSGIGKSPLMHQMAYAVGAGVPFIGYETRSMDVLIADFENSDRGRIELGERICRCLEIDDPGNVEYFTCDVPEDLSDEVSRAKPGLCIIDTLRLFDPSAEVRPKDAANLIKLLRASATRHGTAFLIVHHIRKPDVQAPPAPLIKSPVLEWLLQASGPRALVNQTDVRMGVDGGREDAPLILRGFAKIDGEFGPITLERVIDTNGEPIGYKRVIGAALLLNEAHRKAFAALPNEFRFTDAKAALNTRSDSGTTQFLRHSKDAGLIVKHMGIYRKVDLLLAHT